MKTLTNLRMFYAIKQGNNDHSHLYIPKNLKERVDMVSLLNRHVEFHLFD